MIETIELELKKIIIDSLNLEGVSTQDIQSDAPLFVEGLGLDSIDALELGIAIQKRYNLKFKAQDEDVKKHFYSVKTLAIYIQNTTKKG